jgi:Na+-driven multidrug efflux pump
MLLQSTVNSFGAVVIAGNVAADGVGGIMHQILIGFYSASVSFTGQNYGAKKYKRIDKGLISATCYSVGVVTVLGVIAMVFSNQMLGIFDKNPEVIAAGTPKLMYYGWGYGIFAFSEVLIGCLRGIRKTATPSIVNVVGICVSRVLWILLIFPLMPTIGMVYVCYPISWGLSAAGLLVCYLHYRKEVFRKDPVLT